MASTMFVYFCIAMSQLWLSSSTNHKPFKELAGLVWLAVAIICLFI